MFWGLCVLWGRLENPAVNLSPSSRTGESFCGSISTWALSGGRAKKFVPLGLMELIFSVSYFCSLPKQLGSESTVPRFLRVYLGSTLPVFCRARLGADVTDGSASFSSGGNRNRKRTGSQARC